jgi:hypothetical protein
MLKWLPLMFIVVSLVLSPVGTVIGRCLTQTALRLVLSARNRDLVGARGALGRRSGPKELE